MLQRVEHMHVRNRHSQMIGAIFEPVQAPGQRSGGGIGYADLQFRLQKLELTVEAKDTAVYVPAVQRGRQAEQRIEEADYRNQHHQQRRW